MNEKIPMIPAAVAAVLCAACARHTLDLKGIEVGAMTTPAALQSALAVNCKEATGLCDVDREKNPIKDARVLGVKLKNWRVMTVTVAFRSRDFDEFDKVLRAKFGAPDEVRHEPVDDGDGRENTGEWWIDRAGDVCLLARYATKGGDGLLLMGAAEERSKATTKQQEKKSEPLL